MKIRTLSYLFASLLVTALVGCGGGGGGSSAGGGNVLSGVATKGPISGGTVKVYQIISSATLNPRAGIPRIDNSPVAQGSTSDDGSYHLSLPAGLNKGSLLIQITGGTYTDESTGASRSLDDQYGPNGMRAVFYNISGAVRRGDDLSASVTPYTEMAVRDAATQLTDDHINASNKKIAAAFNLPDIVKTKPLDPNKPFPALGSDDAKKYALALATVSQYQKDYGAGAKMDSLTDALEAQLAGGGLSAQTMANLGASGNNYANGSHNPNSELKDPGHNANAPEAIHATPAAPLSVSIGSSVPISAHVEAHGGTSVPDGTLVNFATNFGTLSALSVPTVNGFANVTLLSSVVGSAQVSVSCGLASATVATISFVDPNAPAGITLTSSAPQGVTTGAPLLISANVARAAGGAVPDGTLVSFAITAGSGNLTGATTTSGGIATVSLASSVANASVTVAASAGSITQTITLPFIAQPTKAIVKLASTGTLASGSLIGGLGATLNYSTGKGLSILPGNIAISGVALGASMAPNTGTAGQVVLGLIDVSGIPTGEFVTLSFDIAAGNFPTAADFSIASGAHAIDVATVDLAGIGVAIASVSIQ